MTIINSEMQRNHCVQGCVSLLHNGTSTSEERWNRMSQTSAFHVTVFLISYQSASRVLHTLVTEKAGLVCDAECSEDGCWGPGPDQCLSCAHFRLGNRCLPDCDSVSGYVALMTLSCIRRVNILLPVLNVMLFFCLLCYQR